MLIPILIFDVALVLVVLHLMEKASEIFFDAGWHIRLAAAATLISLLPNGQL